MGVLYCSVGQKALWFFIGLFTPIIILGCLGLFWEWEMKEQNKGLFKKFKTKKEHIDFHIPK